MRAAFEVEDLRATHARSARKRPLAEYSAVREAKVLRNAVVRWIDIHHRHQNALTSRRGTQAVGNAGQRFRRRDQSRAVEPFTIETIFGDGARAAIDIHQYAIAEAFAIATHLVIEQLAQLSRAKIVVV